MTTVALRTTLIALALLIAAGCSGERSLRCVSATPHVRSTSAPPVRVPDDLSVPDETQALQIPPGDVPPVGSEDNAPPCLELPPDFFDDAERRPGAD